MFTVDIVNIFFTFWLKPMLLLALMISIAKNTFGFCASSRHWFLTSGFFITVLAVALTLFFSNKLIPAVKLEILPHLAAPLTAYVFSQDVASLILAYCLIGAYFLGVFWILSFQFFGLLEIRSISRKAEAINDRALSRQRYSVSRALGLTDEKAERVSIKVSCDIHSPLVWGYLSPLILLPVNWRQWDAGRLQRVLAHEFSHVYRNDWLIKMWAKLFSAIFWPVPLAWVMLRKIEWFSELACDDKVIACYDCRAEYAEDLLFVSRQNEKTGWAMAFNRPSQLFHRIQYVLDARNQRNDIGRKTKYVNSCICLGLILPLFVFHAAPHAAKEELSFDGRHLAQFNKKEVSKPAGMRVFADLPQWPYRKNQFIQILPDSPNFLEEMTVSADVSARLGHEVRKTLSPNADTNHLVALALPKPRLEVKGYLPRVLHTPTYPRNALRKGVEGQVIAQFDIDEHGKVFNARIVYASPKKVFDASVLKALAKSEFSPMEIQGRSVITKNISETFSFRLEKP